MGIVTTTQPTGQGLLSVDQPKNIDTIRILIHSLPYIDGTLVLLTSLVACISPSTAATSALDVISMSSE